MQEHRDFRAVSNIGKRMSGKSEEQQKSENRTNVKVRKAKKKISLAGKENQEQPPRWNSGGGSEPRYTLCGSSTLPALSTFHFFVFSAENYFNVSYFSVAQAQARS